MKDPPWSPLERGPYAPLVRRRRFNCRKFGRQHRQTSTQPLTISFSVVSLESKSPRHQPSKNELRLPFFKVDIKPRSPCDGLDGLSLLLFHLMKKEPERPAITDRGMQASSSENLTQSFAAHRKELHSTSSLLATSSMFYYGRASPLDLVWSHMMCGSVHKSVLWPPPRRLGLPTPTSTTTSCSASFLSAVHPTGLS